MFWTWLTMVLPCLLSLSLGRTNCYRTTRRGTLLLATAAAAATTFRTTNAAFHSTSSSSIFASALQHSNSNTNNNNPSHHHNHPLPRTCSTMTSMATTSTTTIAHTALDEHGVKGEFKRTDASWRNKISKEPGSQFFAEKDRYHLFVAYACPWAHRTLLVRALKGLEDSISVTVVHPIWQKTKPNDPNDVHFGWVFGRPPLTEGETLTNKDGNGGPFPTAFPGNEPDPFFNAKTIREIYERAEDQDGKYSVPVLWDKKLKTIVSNESSEIIRMLNSECNDFCKNPTLDLYPADMREAIDAANAWVYPNINNGVYRCGFAKSQEAYDQAIDELTEAFDKVDRILQQQRFIAGDRFTEADIRLFVTLLRFDEVYAVYFKTNTRSVTHTPAILNYVREIYQMPGVKETVNMEQIKYHYYCSHPTLNYYSIVPRGNNFVQLLEQPHNRDTIHPSTETKSA